MSSAVDELKSKLTELDEILQRVVGGPHVETIAILGNGYLLELSFSNKFLRTPTAGPLH